MVRACIHAAGRAIRFEPKLKHEQQFALAPNWDSRCSQGKSELVCWPKAKAIHIKYGKTRNPTSLPRAGWAGAHHMSSRRRHCTHRVRSALLRTCQGQYSGRNDPTRCGTLLGPTYVHSGESTQTKRNVNPHTRFRGENILSTYRTDSTQITWYSRALYGVSCIAHPEVKNW